MAQDAQRFDPRQIMHRTDFEVFHYRDLHPEAVEMHHHDFYEVYCFLGGEVEYWVDGRIFRLAPGDLLLINPLELHRPMVDSESAIYERIVLWINKDFLRETSPELVRCFDPAEPNHTNLIHLSSARRSAVMARLEDLVREHHSTEFGSELAARGLFLQFMVELNRMAQRAKAPRSKQGVSPLVAQALAYITEHSAEELSLEQIAHELYVSKYHLSHTFRQEVGVSIYRYIMLRRLLTARQLLSGGMSAGDVCTACGFSDYSSFYRAFKAEYGTSPRAFAAGEVTS